jgi:HAD superfamily hydrolase (TIGR01509 family)
MRRKHLMRHSADPAAIPAADPAPGGGLQAVLFDMDGLLVNTEPLWFEVECGVMAALGGEWTEQDQQALVGGSLQRSVAYLLDRSGRTGSHDEVAADLVGGMTRLLAERGVTAMPGALELYAEVAQAGVAHALVTSSERVIMDSVLTALARQDVVFTVTVCAEDVRSPKPDPEPYQVAAALVSADPRYCVALEDSLNGVAAAEAAGCAAVAVPGITPIPARPGRLVARSLAEINLATLRAMVAAR